MSLPFQSFVWYIFGAINAWSRLPIFEVPPDQLNVQNANGIEFERLSYFYPDNFTNSPRAFQLQKNLARLNACVNVGTLATDFKWYFADESGVEVDRITTNSCFIKWKAPQQGTYTVTLIASEKETILFELRRSIRFIDFWIVSIGDSFASGEGNPNRAKNETGTGRAEWLSEKCHRSKKSWAYKVYEKISHFTRNRFAVHFTYLSCSGASVDGGPLPILSQLDAVEAIQKLNGKGPELLMLSAGANDIGFSSIINQLLHKRSLSASRINLRLLFVQHQLDRLAKRLKEKIKPAQVIVPTYFQFANNEQGRMDTKCADLAQMTKRDLRFAESQILERLNELIQIKSNEYSWTAVPEVTDLFDRAGLCAKNSLIRTSSDSIKLQGDAGGALHPTEDAHSQISDLIFSKLHFRGFIPN